MTSHDARECTPYRQARSAIRDGDLLLFRSRSLISIAGRSDYSHAGMACWWGVEGAAESDLFCCEVREFHGGRAVMLSSQVKQRPGMIDVYRPNAGGALPAFDRHAAARRMRRLAGCAYGYGSVLWTALVHVPLARLFVRPSLDDEAIAPGAPFCSQAASIAYRAGGADPVPHLADHFTEPADLARSSFFEYLFTLGPEEKQLTTKSSERTKKEDERGMELDEGGVE